MKENVPYSVAVLVLGIGSIIFSGGLITGIIALILAKKGYDKYCANPELYKGLDMLRAGRICAIIGVTIRSLVFLGVIIAAILWGIGSTCHFFYYDKDSETIREVLPRAIDRID